MPYIDIKRLLSVLLLLVPVTLSMVGSLTTTQVHSQENEEPPDIVITEERLSGYGDFNCSQINKELAAVTARYEYEATPRMMDGTPTFGGNIGHIFAIKELIKVANAKACEERSFDCSGYPLTCEALIRDGLDAYKSGDYASAFRELKPLAEQGLAPAQLGLGTMYERGESVARDYTIAVEWYRRAAEQGYAIAQLYLGNNYRHGLGVQRDYSEAVKWYRKAAEQGHAGGQINLGFMYQSGLGVPQDDAEAFEWYRKAAEQGNAVAQNYLGIIYAAGRGVMQDFAAARDWWLKSVAQGFGQSANNLTILYRDGLGTPKDYLQAYMWFELAVALGDEAAEQGRDEIAPFLTAKQITEAQRMAREWEEKHLKN